MEKIEEWPESDNNKISPSLCTTKETLGMHIGNHVRKALSL